MDPKFGPKRRDIITTGLKGRFEETQNWPADHRLAADEYPVQEVSGGPQSSPKTRAGAHRTQRAVARRLYQRN